MHLSDVYFKLLFKHVWIERFLSETISMEIFILLYINKYVSYT